MNNRSNDGALAGTFIGALIGMGVRSAVFIGGAWAWNQAYMGNNAATVWATVLMFITILVYTFSRD